MLIKLRIGYFFMVSIITLINVIGVGVRDYQTLFY